MRLVELFSLPQTGFELLLLPKEPLLLLAEDFALLVDIAEEVLPLDKDDIPLADEFLLLLLNDRLVRPLHLVGAGNITL